MTEKQIAEIRKILAPDLLKQIRSLERQVKTVSAERDEYKTAPDTAKKIKCLEQKIRTTIKQRDRWKEAANRYQQRLMKG